MNRCTFPPHYTTYSGSGISCPACGRYDDGADVAVIPRELSDLHHFNVFAEIVGAVALVLSVLVLAVFLIGGGNR